MESGSGTVALEHVGSGERKGIGDFAVVVSGDLGNGSAEAEEASVDGTKGFLNSGIIQKILMDVSAELGAGVHQRAAGDGTDLVNDGSAEAGVEDGVADGTGATEEEEFHG